MAIGDAVEQAFTEKADGATAIARHRQRTAGGGALRSRKEFGAVCVEERRGGLIAEQPANPASRNARAAADRIEHQPPQRRRAQEYDPHRAPAETVADTAGDDIAGDSDRAAENVHRRDPARRPMMNLLQVFGQKDAGWRPARREQKPHREY